MMSKNFSNREKVLIAVLAVLVVAAAYYLLVFQPTTAAIGSAEAEIAEVQDLMTIEDAKAVQIANMQKALEEIAGSPATHAVTPIYDNFQDLLDELNGSLALANDYKLNFLSPVFEEGIAKRELQLVFYADNYASAKSIVSRLYAGPYRCDITMLKIVPEEQSETDLVSSPVVVTMTVAYYEIFKEAAPAAQ